MQPIKITGKGPAEKVGESIDETAKKSKRCGESKD